MKSNYSIESNFLSILYSEDMNLFSLLPSHNSKYILYITFKTLLMKNCQFI